MKHDQAPIHLANADTYTGPHNSQVRDLCLAIKTHSPEHPFLNLNIGSFTSGPLLLQMADVPLPGIVIDDTSSLDAPPSLLSLLSDSGMFRLKVGKSYFPVGVHVKNDEIIITHGNSSIYYSALAQRALEVSGEVFLKALDLLQKHLETESAHNQKYVAANFPAEKSKPESRIVQPDKLGVRIDKISAQILKIKLNNIWNNIP
ncbi:MAG: hypothetical protein AAB874_06200 [Patescibacteria group bacterium]